MTPEMAATVGALLMVVTVGGGILLALWRAGKK
jgi:hypothetical protein